MATADRKDHIVQLSILIVDDTGFMRYVLRDLLMQNGLSRVAEAGSRDEALALAASLRPEAVVIDTTHEGAGGPALVTEMAGVLPAARIVAVIRTGDPAAAAAASRAGAEFTVVKPYDPAEVASLLSSLRSEPAAL
ncbi:response regulator [bacterium]|nr:response regulator [bacterium]MBU1675403.1 response regulator [bacterium]